MNYAIAERTLTIQTRSDLSRDYNVKSLTRLFRNRGMPSSDACTLLQERTTREKLRKLVVKLKMTLNPRIQTHPQLELVWSVSSIKTRESSALPPHTSPVAHNNAGIHHPNGSS